MSEVLFLIVECGGTYELARRRGESGWRWVVLVVAGGLLVRWLFAAMAGDASDFDELYFVVRSAWFGVCSLLLVAATAIDRQPGETWRCPECLFFHEPTTLVCPCGFRHP